MFALFRADDQPRLRALLEEVFESGMELSTDEWLVPAPGGDHFVMQVDLVPLDTSESVMIQMTVTDAQWISLRRSAMHCRVMHLA